MKLNRMLDMLVVEYVKLSREEQANNEWLANQHRGNINYIRECLTSHYAPEQMEKVEAMIDERIQSFLVLV